MAQKETELAGAREALSKAKDSSEEEKQVLRDKISRLVEETGILRLEIARLRALAAELSGEEMQIELSSEEIQEESPDSNLLYQIWLDDRLTSNLSQKNLKNYPNNTIGIDLTVPPDVKQVRFRITSKFTQEEFHQIREKYPELELTENMDDYNVIVLWELTDAELRRAITTAGNTVKDDLNADMLMRSWKINPAVIQFEFSKPTTVTGLRFLHSHAAGGRFRLETADTPDDLKNKRGSYAETLPWRETFQSNPGEDSVENNVTFDRPIQVRQARLTVERLQGDDHVHLHGLRLYSRIPLER